MELNQKIILLLQDPTGTFFKSLYKEFVRSGYKIHHINICSGEYFYWIGTKSTNYRGSLKNWPIFLENFILNNKITDIIYHNDRFPYHSVVIDIAKKLNIKAFACECGYLRPDWITLERNGMSSFSHFPCDPETIINNSKTLPKVPNEIEYPCPFLLMAFREVIYDLLNVFFFFFFPQFSMHRYYHPIAEYIHMVPRLFKSKGISNKANKHLDFLIKNKKKYYIFPLQIQSDCQIHSNSPFNHIAEAAQMTMKSFANYAPKNTQLIFKIHPMDCGIEPWHKILLQLAIKLGISDKILIFDGGNLQKMISESLGVITINSTAGIVALKSKRPLFVLGISIYDIEGLTHQGPIDQFWSNAQEPNYKLYESFEKLLASSIQIKGNFHTKEGKKAAASEAVKRIISDKVNAGAFCFQPPRLKKAESMGIPIAHTDQAINNKTRNTWISKYEDLL